MELHFKNHGWADGMLRYGRGALGLFLLGLAGGCQSSPQGKVPDAPPLFRDLIFSEACVTAVAENKPVLVYFDGDWSEESQRFMTDILPRSDISELISQRTVAIHLDVVNAPELTKRYHVNDVPLILLVDGEGKEIDRWGGFKNSTECREELSASLAGETTLERLRAKMKPDDLKGRFKLAQKLIALGNYDEGLAELSFLFVHPELPATSPTHRASRMDIITLVLSIRKSCPAAARTLLEWRQQMESRVLADGKLRSLARAIVTIDRGMGDEDHLLVFFRQLPEGSRARERIKGDVCQVLNKRRAYAEAAELMTTDEAIKALPPYPGLVMRGVIRVLAPSKAGAIIQSLNLRVLAQRLSYFEIYAGAAKVPAARRLAETIIADDKSGQAVKGLRATVMKAGGDRAAALLLSLEIPALQPLIASP